MNRTDRDAGGTVVGNDSFGRPCGDVAIIGMSCLFAGAEGLAAYWSNILNGADAFRDVPAGRWDAEPYLRTEPGTIGHIHCAKGAFLDDSFCFDPRRLRVPPSAIRGADPDHFLLLRCVDDALRDAGIPIDTTAERTEVIIGRTASGGAGSAALGHRTETVQRVLEILAAANPDIGSSTLVRVERELLAELPPFSAETVPGVVPNVAAGRVANRFDFGGANFLVDAACATGLVVVDLAVRSLLTGGADVAIVGAVQVDSGPTLMAVFDSVGALSRDGVCRSFDTGSDGTVIGEGVGVLILKRLTDAERSGDRIYAVIKGVGTSSDGNSTALLSPSAQGERAAIDRAYAVADVSPGSVELVEAHGTGTSEGDRVELGVLNDVFGAAEHPVMVGSVKSMIGHTMVAAGTASLIKTALALHQRTLPPSAHCDRPHDLARGSDSPIRVNVETRPWLANAEGHPRRAGVSAFGFGGVNAHAVLEEYGRVEHFEPPSLYRHWPCELVVVGAESPRGLASEADRLAGDLDRAENLDLGAVACSLNAVFAESDSANRAQRLAVVAHDVRDLVEKLRRFVSRIESEVVGMHDRSGVYWFPDPPGGQLAMLFPGEGSPRVGAMRELAVAFPSVRLAFERFDRLLLDAGGTPVGPYVFRPIGGDEHERDEAETALRDVARAAAVAQAADLAMLELVRLVGIDGEMACGHSGGEWAAMVAGGMLEDIAVAQLHGALVGNVDTAGIPDTAMFAVGTDMERAAALARSIGTGLEVANDNCPHQVVVAVPTMDGGTFADLCRDERIVAERLPLAQPVHTQRYEAVVEPITVAFDNVEVSPSRIPVYACSTASPFAREREDIVGTASASPATSVRFRETVERMYADGARIFVEVGPRNVLTGFVGDILAGKPHHAVALDAPGRGGIGALMHALAQLAACGVTFDLQALHVVRGTEPEEWVELVEGRARNAAVIEIPLRVPRLGLPEPVVKKVETPAPTPTHEPGLPHPNRQRHGEAQEGAMDAYFDTMETFVRSQEDVLTAYLDAHNAP